MDTLKFLIPDTPIVFSIVLVLIGLFLYWIAKLFYSWIRFGAEFKLVRSCADVSVLVESLHSGFTDREREPSEPVFLKFCELKSLNKNCAIAKHIRAIFEAGWTESRLEVAELIKHTTGEIFRGNNLLRWLLGTFIVFGLLGTLFGLAYSLAQLSSVMGSALPGQTNQQLTASLGNLLIHLKSAFAPSIWGVLFTVLGVIFFGFYLRYRCAPVESILNSLTLTVWVPQLLPTTPQRLVETLRRSEEQMRQSFDAARKVADFAKSIQNEVSELGPNLRAANAELRGLTDSSSEISRFTDGFIEATASLTSFQTDIRDLYQQMVSESTAFQRSISEITNTSEAFQRSVMETHENQDARLQEILSSLQISQDAYFKDREGIHDRVQDVLRAATKALGELGARNRELVEEIGKPLIEKLDQQLREIEQTLRVQLAAVTQELGKMDAPVRASVDKIEGALEAVVKRTETLTKELQQEFFKQHELSREQLSRLNELNTQIVALLNEFSAGSRSQRDQIEVFTNGIISLNETLSAVVRKLPEVVKRQMSGGGVGYPSGSRSEARGHQDTRAILKELLRRIFRL